MPPPPAANTTGNGTANGTDAAPAPAPAPAGPPEMRKRVLKVPLNLTGGFLAPGMNRTELEVGGWVGRAGHGQRVQVADLLWAGTSACPALLDRLPTTPVPPLACPRASQASRRVLRRMRARDSAKRETAKARNDLEAYVISTRGKVRVREWVGWPDCRAGGARSLGQAWTGGDGSSLDRCMHRAAPAQQPARQPACLTKQPARLRCCRWRAARRWRR